MLWRVLLRGLISFYTPSVHDSGSIDIWAQIGVIILLFTLGLEFSFKKILKMGAAPVIAALTIIFCMMFLGTSVGHLFGWKSMDCIYLGGMLAMSSTTIIYKAFQDLGVLQKKFAGVVLSVLILEDILAIVLMVMLSTLAVSHNIEGEELIEGLLRLGFFLILWFVVGLYLIPIILRKNRKFLNSETLLIVSLALCFVMAVVAVESGFSAAFGAFVVGSILAETVEAERIEKLVAPVKDLFGAIFFVSVGMLVDPEVLVEYAWPIAALTLAIIVGQAFFRDVRFRIGRAAVERGDEVRFQYVANRGICFYHRFFGDVARCDEPLSLSYCSSRFRSDDFHYALYAESLRSGLFLVMPRAAPRLGGVVGTLYAGHGGAEPFRKWKKLISAMLRQIVVFTILSVTVIALSFRFLLPFTERYCPIGGRMRFAESSRCFASLLFAGIMARGRRSSLFQALWKESRYNRLPLVFTLIARAVVVCMLIFLYHSLF